MDIDCDIQDDRREEVIDYVRKKYGYNHVSRIVTFQTAAARAVVRLIARVTDKPVALGDKIAKTIPNKPKMTLDKAFEESPAFAQLYNEEPECKEIIDKAKMLEGLKTGVGIHACFTGDTRVQTHNGFKTIKSLAEKGEEFLARSWDPVERKFPLSRAIARKTRENAELVRVTYTNGERTMSVRCTPDHRFMTKDEAWVEAQNLQKGQVLKTNGVYASVVRVKKLQEREDVYCLTVPKYHNFCLELGITVHNCGVLITPKPVVDFMPQAMVRDKDTGEYVATTQLTMVECEDAGCLKMDFLGLRSLGVIASTINQVNSKQRSFDRVFENIAKDESKDNISKQSMDILRSRNVDFNDIPRDDLRVYEWLAKGNTQGVFQYESPYMRGLCQELLQNINEVKATGAECFDRLSAGSALGRPGPMAEIPHFIDNMLHPEKITYDVEQMKTFLGPTFSIMVYQEQAMTMVRELAGFSAGQADLIRKGMA